VAQGREPSDPRRPTREDARLSRRRASSLSRAPLEKINKESAREKSILHVHPSKKLQTLWWGTSWPLLLPRAVLFRGQLVDDPSAHPDRFPNRGGAARRARTAAAGSSATRLSGRTRVDSGVCSTKRTRRSLKSKAATLPPPSSTLFPGGCTYPNRGSAFGLEAQPRCSSGCVLIIK